MGVSGCGKSVVGSRLADALGAVFVEGDTYHPAANVAKMSAGIPLQDEDRRDWLWILHERIRQARDAGQPLVLACSSLKRRYRDLLRSGDPDLIFVHLQGARDVIAQRMQTRPGHFMPLTLLDSQFRDLEPLQPDERGCVEDIVLPPDAIVTDAIGRCAPRLSEGDPL